MSTPVFTIAALKAVLGDDFPYQFTEARGGNLQVSMVDSKAGRNNPSPFTQITALYRAVVRLRKAGYDIRDEDVNTQSRKSNGDYSTWLCVWVNKTRIAQGQGAGSTADILANLIKSGAITAEAVVRGLAGTGTAVDKPNEAELKAEAAETEEVTSDPTEAADDEVPF